ncbi:MAG: aminotransferase class V-fold PLP-dependent enzyme [Chromatiales bacterium]
MMSEDQLAGLIAHEFPLADDIVYLNHAGVAPWPRRAAEAVTQFARENARTGARNYPDWLHTECRLRQLLATLINAESPDDIALLKNTSEGLSFVAAGFEWCAGDVVIISDQEFPSNRIVWEALADRGVTVRRVSLVEPGLTPEAALMGACDGRTRLMSVSAVQYATGLRLDIAVLGGFCRSRGIRLCVDAIQQLGALPFDAQTAQADFVVADGHKWMLGPEGVALFYVQPGIRQQLRLTEFGWHMTAQPGDYDRLDWTPGPTARRFECGSPNLLGTHALAASVGLLLEVGIERVAAMLMENISYLIKIIEDLNNFSIASDTAMERRSGILSVRPTAQTATQLHQFLSENGVICALRGGCLRFSPHFYTSRERLDRLGALLAQAAERA